MVSTKNMKLFSTVNIIRSVSWASNQHIEWFLKDHVTPKTEEMAAEKNQLLKYIKIENI